MGAAEEPAESLRFVIQHHMARKEHYDVRLEWNGALMSWAVPKGPSFDPRDRRLSVRVEDHPLEYRSFEGTIPKGEYGGGTVMIWDEGLWEPYGDVDAGLKNGSLKFSLLGKRLKGGWALIRLKSKGREAKDNWLLLKEKDGRAKADAGISGFMTSVRTGRTMEEIAAGAPCRMARNPFVSADVQLAKLVSSVPREEDWLYELKFDGYRILAYIEYNDARLMTRNGNDFTGRFRDIALSLAGWSSGRAMVLDGEMVVTDARGRTDFQALQSCLRDPRGKKLTYIVFDLLALDGEDLRGRPLIVRKAMLGSLMKGAPENLIVSQYVKGHGEECFRAACEANLEGIVGKHADSVYSGTRNGDWIKLKCDKRREFVIGGYTISDRKASGISSLLLGYFDDGRLVYAGRAGTGLGAGAVKELEKRFKGLERADPPFHRMPPVKKDERTIWLDPLLAAEIKFAGMTGQNLLRQASFKGLREDMDPGDIGPPEPLERSVYDDPDSPDAPARGIAAAKPTGGTVSAGSAYSCVATEQTVNTSEANMTESNRSIIVNGVKVSNPDKVVFNDPKVTKEDIVRYYACVAERMLPYMSHRILSIVRCPKGVGEACFYKKHPNQGSEGIVTVTVPGGDGEEEEYFYIEDAYGLVSEAQMGTLEFHTWQSRADDPERPDIMVFDLDPDEGMETDRVRLGVKDLKSILDELSLASFLKTSGGKGYHVLVPFPPSMPWESFSGFARQVAELMEQKWPDRYTSNIRKAKRRNRIFIDWIRNNRGATSIAPYSLRAREGAKVSMPISWDELDTVAPDGIDITEALKRIGEADPWIDFIRSRAASGVSSS